MADDVTVLIEGKEFRFWTEVTLNLSIDTYSTVDLRAPFEPDRKEFRDVFRPFTFKPLEVQIDGETVFTGTLVDVLPDVTPKRREVEVTAYALPALLQDCDARDELPIEFQKQGLRAIAEKLAAPFGINVVIQGDPGATFDKVAIDVGGKVQDFLADLARQRNLVITDAPDGTLLCWRSAAAGNPRARLVEGLPPIGNVDPSFSPQEYFSEITGYSKTKGGSKGAPYTVPNPWLPQILRPMSVQLEDTESGDAPEAVRAKMGRMFANMASFNVPDIPTWRDPKGRRWERNTTVSLLAPGAMVYTESELLIRTVSLTRSATRKSATLNLVLPGAFAGTVPDRLPWFD